MNARRFAPRYRAVYVNLRRTDRSPGTDRGRSREDSPRPMMVFDNASAVTYSNVAHPLRGIAKRPRQWPPLASHAEETELPNIRFEKSFGSVLSPDQSGLRRQRVHGARQPVRLREIDDLSDSGRVGKPGRWGELLQRQPHQIFRADGPRHHDGVSGPRTLSSHMNIVKNMILIMVGLST